MHTQFVTKGVGPVDSDKLKFSSDRKDLTTSSQRTSNKRITLSELDSVFGDKIPKVKVPDSNKIAAILKEHDVLVLQKHLLTTTVHNQVRKFLFKSIGTLCIQQNNFQFQNVIILCFFFVFK